MHGGVRNNFGGLVGGAGRRSELKFFGGGRKGRDGMVKL